MKRFAAALFGVVAIACAKPASLPAKGAGPEPSRIVSSAAPLAWSYEVAQVGEDLDVTATFPPGTAETMSLEDDATRYVSDLSIETAPRVAAPPVVAREGIWTLPSCARGCTLHYRFHLNEAARGLADVDSAVLMHNCIEAPPSSWLVRPTDAAPGTTYRFHVRAAPGARFATGVRPVAGAIDTYGAAADDLDTAPYSLFGPFRSRTVAIAGASIDLAILPGKLGLDDAAIDHWIDISARAIEAYYGRFPVPRFLLLLVPRRGRRGETVDGRTLASGGSSILLGVSAGMAAEDIPRDWVLTHEMTHLALPSLRRDHHWLEEGLATYVEPIARAKVGTIPESEVWRGLIDGLPNGLPAPGDEGLDRTHTWGRTYWGGALFSFVADLEIRHATANEKSLEDALRGIVAAGGVGEARWSIEDVLREGDRATGVRVLESLYAKWSGTPVDVNLERLWDELGVHERGEAITFDDRAPLAEVRWATTHPKVHE